MRMWQFIVKSPAIALVGLNAFIVAWTAESRLVRTVQMWGSETAEEKGKAS
jgi:hypothetical protein